jgi:hypothetical protein
MGLRVYAFDDEYLPPIVTMSQKITIEFDVAAFHPPDIQIIFVHASKDWVADKNAFLNDESHNKSQQLQFTVAPSGVHHYAYHYKNFFPDDRGIVRFPYSGNYLFSVIDKGSNTIVLGGARFIVVENSIDASMRVENKYYSEQTAPFNQMHYITVNVNVPAEENQPTEGRIYHPNVKTIDIIQNWELFNPFRIDVEDKNPDTFVEEYYRPNKKFKIRNVPPGNEYRRLDIGSVRFYPNEHPVRLKEGADLSRYQWQGKIDANGAAKLRPFTGANSDYLDVMFRLELPSPNEKSIFLVGAFNQWEPSTEYKMELDSLGKMYTLHKWIRRGVYDYQYVVGNVDPSTGNVIDQDWLVLEGNDWRTISRYTAIVYYHDERFGGFDRVAGSATAKSPGGTEETKMSNNQ